MEAARGRGRGGRSVFSSGGKGGSFCIMKRRKLSIQNVKEESAFIEKRGREALSSYSREGGCGGCVGEKRGREYFCGRGPSA